LASDKGTSENHKTQFPEVRGKIVDTVELIVEPDYYGITIRFEDKTALVFPIEPCVFTFPVLEDWTQGEAKIIKEYQAVQSVVQRA